MTTAVEEKTGAAAILAILLALGGVVMTVTGHPVWGLLSHMGAVALGAIGLVMAASPRVSGGMMSIAAIILAVLATGLDLVVLLGTALF
jgi:hypothetical protein